jgi:hypothetical protein
VVDCWAYLGTAASLHEAPALLERGQQRFDRDVYHIMQKWLPRLAEHIVDL